MRLVAEPWVRALPARSSGKMRIEKQPGYSPRLRAGSARTQGSADFNYL
jgi:hypothetical protein